MSVKRGMHTHRPSLQLGALWEGRHEPNTTMDEEASQRQGDFCLQHDSSRMELGFARNSNPAGRQPYPRFKTV